MASAPFHQLSPWGWRLSFPSNVIASPPEFTSRRINAAEGKKVQKIPAPDNKIKVTAIFTGFDQIRVCWKKNPMKSSTRVGLILIPADLAGARIRSKKNCRLSPVTTNLPALA
jgi:hypothetical protein